MPKTWRKGCAILLVSAMMMTGLAMLSTPAKADYNATTDIAFDYDDAYQEPNAAPADNVVLIYNYDLQNMHPYWLGDTGDWIQIGIVNRDTANPIFNVNVTLASSDSAIFNIVGDDGGTDATDGNLSGPNVINTTIAASGTGNVRFRFDVSNSTALGLHDLQVTVTYDKPWASAQNSGSKAVRIYISSIVDQHNVAAVRDDHNGLDRLNETTTTHDLDINFEAGDRFTEGHLNVTNYATAITNVVFTLTAPTTTPVGQITIVGGNNVAQVPGGWAQNAVGTARWRFNVADDTKPGIYTATVKITFTRNGQTIDEGTRNIEFRVDFNFESSDSGSNINELGEGYSRNQCWASEVTITDTGEPATTRQVGMTDLPYDTYEQSKFSDKKITMNITIINNANSPLYQATFRIDMMGWRFFRDPTFFYTTAGAINFDRNELSIEELGVGDTVNVTIEVIVLKEAPVGEHRLRVNYTGYYYDDGSLGGSTGYYPINGSMANPLIVLFSILVSDSALDCHISAGGITMTNANYNNDITESTMTVIIWNDEAYTFIDIKVTADFTGTPFYNPLVTERTTRGRLIDAQQNPITTDWTYMSTLNGNGTGITFIVDIDPSAVPDRYRFSFNVTAIIKDTLETVSAIVYGEFSTIGYGPRISIEAFTAGDITPGQDFPLTLTIRNDGDEPLRDGWVSIDSDTVNQGGKNYWQDWGAICDFIGQIQRENATYNEGPFAGEKESYEWDGAEVTLQQLDIDSAKEIIELNLYMDGVYSTPAARITLVRIREPLNPGQTVDVSFTMMTDKDMVKGKPYAIEVDIFGKNEGGGTSGFYPIDQLEITVRTKENGQSYQGVEWNWFDDGMKLLGLFLFLVIIIVIVLIAFKRLVSKKHEEHDHVHEPPVDNPPPQ